MRLRSSSGAGIFAHRDIRRSKAWERPWIRCVGRDNTPQDTCHSSAGRERGRGCRRPAHCSSTGGPESTVGKPAGARLTARLFEAPNSQLIVMATIDRWTTPLRRCSLAFVALFPVLLVFGGICVIAFTQVLLYLFLQMPLFLLHPAVTHRRVLGRVRFQFRPVHGHMPQLDQSRPFRDPHRLQEKIPKRFVVPPLESRYRPEIRLLVRGGNRYVWFGS